MPEAEESSRGRGVARAAGGAVGRAVGRVAGRLDRTGASAP